MAHEPKVLGYKSHSSQECILVPGRVGYTSSTSMYHTHVYNNNIILHTFGCIDEIWWNVTPIKFHSFDYFHFIMKCFPILECKNMVVKHEVLYYCSSKCSWTRCAHDDMIIISSVQHVHLSLTLTLHFEEWTSGFEGEWQSLPQVKPYRLEELENKTIWLHLTGEFARDNKHITWSPITNYHLQILNGGKDK